MKIRVTEKAIKEGFKNIICVGYCDLQYLLYYTDPDFNTTGIYGWKADFYKINNNTIISTGYQPIGSIRNYKLNRKYDEKARKIVLNYNLKYETKVKKLNNLLKKYIEEIMEEESEVE